MNILKATERSILDIPISEIIGKYGDLKLHPALTGKGFVEIKQAKTDLRLHINGVVGRLPLTEHLALDVNPKFSISNFNRVVYMSKSYLKNPFSMTKSYEAFQSKVFLPVPLIKTFSANLSNVVAKGLLREYRQEVYSDFPRPRIKFTHSFQRHWSKLQSTKAVVERFNYVNDNPTNQCLKLAAERSLSVARESIQLKDVIPMLANCLRQLNRIKSKSAGEIIAQVEKSRTKLPSYRMDYHEALVQAFQIISCMDIVLDGGHGKTRLDSFLISMDDVFEKYIRNIVADLPDVGNGRIATVDGNKRAHQRKLFSDNKKYDVKPDLVVKDSRGPVLLGDVKYKVKPVETDRYQVITHSLSYQVSRAILVYPKPVRQDYSGCKRLGKVGSDGKSVELFEYHFDLAGDLDIEEDKFKSTITKLAQM